MDGDLLYCTDISGLIQLLNISYNPEIWRMFIGSSKTNLKVALLHNGTVLASIPISHVVHIKETYSNMKQLLRFINWYLVKI